jgi:hypothetical protein
MIGVKFACAVGPAVPEGVLHQGDGLLIDVGLFGYDPGYSAHVIQANLSVDLLRR